MKVSPRPVKWTTGKNGLFSRNTNLRNTQIINTAVYSNLLGTGTVLHMCVFTLLFHSEESAALPIILQASLPLSGHLSTQFQGLKLHSEFRDRYYRVFPTQRKYTCHSALVFALKHFHNVTPPQHLIYKQETHKQIKQYLLLKICYTSV